MLPLPQHPEYHLHHLSLSCYLYWQNSSNCQLLCMSVWCETIGILVGVLSSAGAQGIAAQFWSSCWLTCLLYLLKIKVHIPSKILKHQCSLVKK